MPDDKRLPPPLPPRPIVPEPFRRVDSAPPLAVDRNAVTPPSGGVPIYDPDPRDGMIREMQQTIALLREQLDQGPDTPAPVTRPSVRARKAQAAKLLGKWVGLLALLPLVGAGVAKKWPEYSGIVDLVLQLVGLK